MKILIVNKFLYPNGGSETYIFEIGKRLEALGHEVQFFGMEHKGRIVGNNVNAYTADMDFHGSRLSKITYPFKIIYSFDARRQIRKVLDDMQPDVVHMNNINFQITPSIIDEIEQYKKKTGRTVKMIVTAHDSQWVCPNHLMRIPSTNENCDRCLSGNNIHCAKNKCIHNSRVKSIMAMLEADFYKHKKTYSKVDIIICPSRFMFNKLKRDKLLRNLELVMRHNFIVKSDDYDRVCSLPKKDYVLYFGRYSEEKGIGTLLNAVKNLPEIPFVFAGNGPLESEVNSVENIENRGFVTGEELHALIRQARYSILPSECYENCPFTVMESITYGTPVIGANIGGIPELIGEDGTGLEFESGDVDDLTASIFKLWTDEEKLSVMAENCKRVNFDTIETYVDWLISEIYV